MIESWVGKVRFLVGGPGQLVVGETGRKLRAVKFKLGVEGSAWMASWVPR